LDNKVKEPPIINLDFNNNISFTNGRYRFANLRDNNVINIPVLINQMKDFKKQGLIQDNSKTKSKPNTKISAGKNKTKRNKNK